MFPGKLYVIGGLSLIFGLGLTTARASELGHADVHLAQLELPRNQVRHDQIGRLADGRLILTTGAALLLHDGRFSETVPLPAKSLVHQVLGEPDGSILVGARHFLARARPRPGGGWDWEDLGPTEKQHREVLSTNFYMVTPLPEGLALRGDGAPTEVSAGWSDPTGRWTTWSQHYRDLDPRHPELPFIGVGRHLYRLEARQKLSRWHQGAWQHDRTLTLPLDDAVKHLTEFDEGRLRLVLHDGTLVNVERDGEVRRSRFPSAPEIPARLNFVFDLPGEALAWVDQNNTLRFLRADGYITSTIDSTTGLPPGVVRPIVGDPGGQFWAGVGGQIVRLNHPLHLTRFDRFNGLSSPTVHSLVRHDGRLYAGTEAGVYRLTPDPAPGRARFAPLPGPQNRVSALTVFQGQLLAGSTDGVFTLRDDRFELIPDSPVRVTGFYPSVADPHLLYLAGDLGARRIKLTDTGWDVLDRRATAWTRAVLEQTELGWWTISSHGDLSHDVPVPRRLADPSPGGPNLIGMARLTMRMFGQEVSRGSNLSRDLAMTQGEASDLQRWGETPIAVTTTGIFDLGHPEFPNLLDHATRDTLGEQRRITRFAPTSADEGWVVLGPAAEDVAANLGWQVRLTARDAAEPLRVLPATATAVGEIHALLPEGDILWVGGERGLLRLDLRGLPAPAAPPTLRLHASGALAGSPTGAQLPHNHPAIAFAFATPDPAHAAHTTYRSRLLSDGAGDWSPFTLGTTREIARLPAGRHRLEVQARNADGLLSPIAAFDYVVSPPWWLSVWAALAGVALVLALMFATMRWTARRGLARAQRLETLVAERTATLRASEHQLAQAKLLAEDAMRQAERANHAKSAFIAAMSHELRTPLNAILGFAQILRREPSLSPKGRSRIDVIDRNGQHLLGMINEVLDLSKIEADKMRLQLRPCSLRRLATGVAEICEPRNTEKHLSFHLEFGPDVPAHVMADETKLRQVLINLLGNAIKFTPRGRVTLALSRAAEKVRFEITDTGPGVPPESREAIFEPFHQGPHEDDPGGTGLGLPISQRLVALMGGRIHVDAAPGGGARFWFDLAFTPAEAPVASASPLRITGYVGPRLRVLVVDDVETNRAVLREMLGGVGFEVTEAATGEAALDSWSSTRAHLVLLDLRLPGISGADTARRLREFTPRPRLIAVSASVFSPDQTLAPATACDAFVPKPVDEALLFRTIGEQLDLVWTFTEPPFVPTATEPAITPLAPDAIAALPLPPPDTLAAWLELARGADLHTLRLQLDAAHATGPDREFRLQLDSLAARYRASAIRQILLKTRNLAPADPT
ncbi:ATP-binding protein [Spirulina sp. CCNP1310]|uniref:ATP-binding protein n=1 Tax=Spirulina sp. CCNP1310 TaxID=3110249 RepID=UPI002B1F5755|nr:ATP-binding protein [Spirulina sp. CCNP1310]MEA5421549.1 ATP-binding protein [Spirulina sp. CCNP1310]